MQCWAVNGKSYMWIVVSVLLLMRIRKHGNSLLLVSLRRNWPGIPLAAVEVAVSVWSGSRSCDTHAGKASAFWEAPRGGGGGGSVGGGNTPGWAGPR